MTTKSHVVLRDEDGSLVYEGLLTDQEMANIDEILESLKREIPEVEATLKKKYGNSVWYKYYLGKFLGKLVDKHGITVAERRKFWDEIKNFATSENRKRDEGGAHAATRSFFQQCYELSKIDKNVVGRLRWWQWQEIFDRASVFRDDERIFQWFGHITETLDRTDFREFSKALNLYLKGKDTSVFSQEELFDIYDSLLMISKEWTSLFNEYIKNNPLKEIEDKSKLSLQYYAECFSLKKKKRNELSKEICQKAFSKIIRKARPPG